MIIIPEILCKHISNLRSKGIYITDEEAEDVYHYCLRKMYVAKVDNPEKYIEVLYPDELNHYILRHGINASTILRKMEESVCA